MADVKINLRGLSAFQREVSGDLRKKGQGRIRKALRQCAAVYRSDMSERFDTFSKGGGDWAPLKKSTIARRRKGRNKKAKRKASILRDTGTLFAALNTRFTGKPGQVEKDIPFGIRVGIGGSGKHPSGSITVAKIASFHQLGKGRLPKRQIIVEPSTGAIKRMSEILTNAMQQTAKRSG